MGAFEGGAYTALDEAGLAAGLAWVAGSSVGAISAAILAGNAPADRVPRLRQFWSMLASDPAPLASFWFGPPQDGLVASGLQPGQRFRDNGRRTPRPVPPRLYPGPRAGANDVPSLYDLQPLRDTLPSLVDFDRLNDGAMRVTLCATDVVSGERVVFRHRAWLPDRAAARGRLLRPAAVFAPVEVDGRLLGDGGLSSNAPADLVLTDPAAEGLRCFVVDLFEARGQRPHTLAASASRAGDLAFGNQSRRLLEAQKREDHLRGLIRQLGALLPEDTRTDPATAAILAEGRAHPADTIYISYRAGLDEAGLGKVFDFSAATIADRWQAGSQQMQAALQGRNEPPAA